MGAEQHWKQFCEFVEYELATGGPDPHARYVGTLLPKQIYERVWRGGLYAAVYTAPTAEAIWRAWPYERAARNEPGLLHGWLKGHWAGLPLRRERRAVRTPEKLARSLESYIRWMDYGLPAVVSNMAADPYAAYEQMWQAADSSLWGFGRYALTKLLDFYEQYCEIPISMPDIRPVDGWSPRETLELFYPENKRIAPRSLHQEAIAASDAAAARARTDLAIAGFPLDWFRFEVLLCEYRQSAVNERQYPGRSIDSELTYLKKVEEYWLGRVDRNPAWGSPSDIWDVRKAIHPAECLGELNGWDAPRDVMATWLGATSETWSDLIWKYDDPLHITRRSDNGRERIRNLARKALGEGAHKQPISTR